MSEYSPPVFPGDVADGNQTTLTPDVIDSVLAEFRSWLHQIADTLAGKAGFAGDGEADGETIDLSTLLGQFLALRHEVNLQTRAARTQQEQTAGALQQLGQATEALRHLGRAASEADRQQDDERLRPLLKTLVDLGDVLQLAEREVARVQVSIALSLEQLSFPLPMPPEEPAPARSTLFRRWFGKGLVAEHEAVDSERGRLAVQTAETVRQVLDSVVTGYRMSVQRVQRTLEQHGLEPIACCGVPFDPETMEVVEVVANTGVRSGDVTDEVRRGYLWRGRIFRFAQVRVAK